MAEHLTLIAVLQKLCKTTNKWGMFISIHERDEIDYEKECASDAAPYLKISQEGPFQENDGANLQIIADNVGYFLFDTKEEMGDYFWQTVGNDGPTKSNHYEGNISIYALTCSPEGQTLNENT